MNPLIAIIGSLADLAGSAVYIGDMVRGHTRPNRVTYFLWALAPCVAAAASFADGARWPALCVFSTGLGPLAVFIASFFCRTGVWKLGRLDYVCGALSLIGIVLWQATAQPALAVLFAVLSDFLAAVPTIRKAWIAPETENVWGYAGAGLNGLAGFVTVETWIFSIYAFPAYFALVNGLLLSVLLGRKRRGAAFSE